MGGQLQDNLGLLPWAGSQCGKSGTELALLVQTGKLRLQLHSQWHEPEFKVHSNHSHTVSRHPVSQTPDSKGPSQFILAS